MTKRVHTSEKYDHYGKTVNDLNIAVAVRNNKIGKMGWLGNHYPFRDWGRKKSLELFERDLQWLIESSPVLRAKFLCMDEESIACTCPDHMDCHVNIIINAINDLKS